jgi:membrane protease YdiL (CAAX protease family)
VIALPARLRGGRLRARTAWLTFLLLAAALLRAALLPLGDGLSTLVFACCLLGLILLKPVAPPAEPRWGRWGSMAAGLGLGLLLLAPLLGGFSGRRPVSGFLQWGAIAALIATLEEVAIRGRLQQQWTEDAGPLNAILAGAAVFALIHLPRYGLSAMPLDFSVGLALGGLRALTGRVMPGAIAHVMADWGAWFAV